MKTIQILNGILSEPLPADAIRCDRDGDVVIVWQEGDVIPEFDVPAVEENPGA